MSLIKPSTEHKLQAFRRQLISDLNHYQNRVARARQELPVESGPVDLVDLANRTAYRESTMGNLERDLQTIIEIEKALHRMELGQYATCAACQGRIPDARLDAIPWARTCIECAGGRPRLMGSPFGLKPSHSH
jgi:DnaK suppressor protein